MLGTVMLGVHFREMLLCDLGRKGKAGVQVHCRAFGGAWGSWCRNKGEQVFRAVDGVWREESSGAGRLLWAGHRASGPERGPSSQPASPGRRRP